MSRLLERAAAVSAAVGVAAGAFGAHDATGQAAELFKTGGQYQLVHAVAVVAALALGVRKGGPLWLLAGSLLFSLSLYGLALGAPHWTGAITPIGGLGMIIGWLWIALRLGK